MEEFELKQNQYGGVSGCSTTHMVIEVLQMICKNAEDYRCATVLAAINYSTALNRVSYQHCLDAFQRKGASTPIIRLIASFLTNRSMSVRIGGCWSEPLPVSGGCPQGSVLGARLFKTATDDLEDKFVEREKERKRLPRAAAPQPYHEPEGPTEPVRPTASTPTRPYGPDIDGSHLTVSPVRAGGFSPGAEAPYVPRLDFIPVPQPVMITSPASRRVGTQVLV